MHITDIMRGDSPTFSFEFFPPRSPEAAETLYQTIRDLESYMPHFVSVTYGAGGSTRDLTHDLVERIKQTTKLDPIPHLTCVCHNEEEIDVILTRYAKSAIGNILALGGDRPIEMPYDKSRDSFRHAIDLVKFIRRFNESGVHLDPRGFGIGVAGFPEGHPATPNRLIEMDHLKAKVDAGAEYIITQMFFDNQKYFEFVKRCRDIGITIPIIPGLKPITTKKQLTVIPRTFYVDIPNELANEIMKCKTDEEVAALGTEWLIQQSKELKEFGVPVLHYYTLGKPSVICNVIRAL